MIQLINVVRYLFSAFLGRPRNDSSRKAWCFTAVHYLSFLTRDLRGAGPTAAKFWHMVVVSFIIPVQKFGRLPPTQKNRGQKHAKFGAILDTFPLWARISPEWIAVSKVEKLNDRQRVLPRLAKKVWWTLVYQPRRFEGAVVPTKSTFLEDHILASMGCCAPKFLHALQNGQGLLTHTTPNKFLQKRSKIDLKCNVLIFFYTFGAKESSLMKLYHLMCH